MTHQTLVKLGTKWLSHRASVVLSEFRTNANEIPDVVGWGHTHSTVIECKISRSDFLRDKEKIHRRKPELAMGHYRYFLCPANLIQPEELPKKWGLLYAAGAHVTVVKQPKGHPQRNRVDEISFLVSMLRRAQIRIGTRPLSEWLRGENQFEAVRGQSPNSRRASA